jgi:site-specific recombinase XerD
VVRANDSSEYGLVVTFLAYTGLRLGEMAALRVRRVDVVARRVEVAESVTAINGVLSWGTPKGHARRWVGVPPFIAGQLARHIAGKAAEDRVFSSPGGEVLRVSNFRRDVFTPAAASVGLAGLVPHGVRHTAASLAIAAGADVKVVQQILGHKSATMTLDLCGHPFESRIDEVADALDKAARVPDVAPAWPQGNVADLEAARKKRAARQTSGLQAVPPARIELASPGFGDRPGDE